MNCSDMARRLALGALIASCVLVSVIVATCTSPSAAQAPQGVALAATVVVPERGGAAGNAADGLETTYTFAADNASVPLVRLSGVPIDLASVPSVYGLDRGMTIYDAGQNVASASYSAFSGPLTPAGQDLSGAAGWPNVTVPAGQVAIDPTRGRFAFHDGGAPLQKGRAGNGSHNAVALQGGYAYVTDWVQGLYIYDISDPADPTFVGHWERIEGSDDGIMDVIVDGRYAYLATKWHGLRVIDVLDRAHPKEVASSQPFNPQYSLHMAKAGNLIYMTAEANGVLIYNVATPTAPAYIGRFHNGQFGEGVFVQDAYAYVAVSNNGLSIWDVNNPGAPVGGLTDLGTCFDVAVSGNYAYLAANDALRVVNVSDRTKPKLVTEIPTIARAYDVYVYGGYVLVGEYSNSGTGYVQVFDLQDPADPLLARTCVINNANPGVMGVRALNGLIYAAATAKGLVILDPNLPQAPRGAVTVDYNWLDDVEPPTPTPTLDPSTTVTLTLQVERQGRGTAPSDRWAQPLWVQVATPGEEDALYTYELVADTNGRVTVSGVPQGIYDVRVRGRTSLYRAYLACPVVRDGPVVEIGLLAEGDGNLDGHIDIVDFSLLASAYGRTQEELEFDPRVDFDDDGTIGLFDFSLLASNYGLAGPLSAAER